MKKISVYIAAFALWALALSGCPIPLIGEPWHDSGNTAILDTPENFGTVQVSFSRGAARTVMPEADLNALYIKYLFTKNSGNAEEKTPDSTDAPGSVFTLEAGDYTLEVKAFADAACTMLAAQGATEAAFTVRAGATASPVNITLRPVVTGEGTGNLDFSLEYPAGTVVDTFTLTQIAGSDPAVDLKAAGTAFDTGLSGVKTDIPVGYYLLRAMLKNADGIPTGKTEVVHIYQNLSAQANYVFTADDFRAFRVTTAEDSGTGSLRAAITSALGMTETPQTIQIVLPVGSVIELQNPLPKITKSLTIEGNGVTLTPAATWTSTEDSQLLYNGTTAATLTVRRLHLKDGRATTEGAGIHSNGPLILESCILSGNMTTDSQGYGGAIYVARPLVLRGCTFYRNEATNRGGVAYIGSSGSLTVTGNLFYGCTGRFGPVISGSSSVGSGSGYNVVDVDLGNNDTQSGWRQQTGDKKIEAGSLPVSPKTFRLYESDVMDMLPDPLPGGYPALDFYGNPIQADGAAGAVQAAVKNTTGLYLALSVNNASAGTVTANPGPDEDGFVSAGSITITAQPNPGYVFRYWKVNGSRDSETTVTLTKTLASHTEVQAVFARPVTVNVFTDGAGSVTTPGTLRHALANAADGDLIRFSDVTPGTTVVALESALPQIIRNIAIEGEGVTLTRANTWTTAGEDTQLLNINSAVAEVTISRVHFKNGRTMGEGGAIRSLGPLTLESCIFSGNQSVAGNMTRGSYGGAIYANGLLTIRGCTFHGNSADSSAGSGGAIRSGNAELILEGNLFYDHTAGLYPVLSVGISGSVSPSYNAVDMTFGTSGSGWAKGTGDKEITAGTPPVSPLSFRLLSGSGVANTLPTPLPAGYPVKDFYGTTINAGGAAGAVQAYAASPGNFYLGLSVSNAAAGTITASPAPDADGLFPAGQVTVTAAPVSGSSFSYWKVNGSRDSESSTTLTIALNAHIEVEAVFSRPVTVSSSADDENTPGTLRYALANAADGDIINITGVQVIELQSPLDPIVRSITIEGNNVTLTRKASDWTANQTSQLLYISSSAAEITIRRVRFENGFAYNSGAIWNKGILTLESCIFAGNRGMDEGGAVDSTNTLTIRGSTFYNNTATAGGAVQFYAPGKTLTLTGNLFYGNKANTLQVVRVQNGNIEASYNAVDVPFGTGAADCGFVQDSGSTNKLVSAGVPQVSSVNFKLPSGGEAAGMLPNPLPAGYPVKDFYGDTITTAGAAGAVQSTGNGFYVGLLANNSAAGSLAVSGGTDTGGSFYSSGSSITITATPRQVSGLPYVFGYWLVNGIRGTETSNILTINGLSAHTQVQAVFVVAVTDFTDATGSTSQVTLRYALTNARDGDTVMFKDAPAGTIIKVGSVNKNYLEIRDKSLTIEGEGVTLERESPTIWPSNMSTYLLYVRNQSARIRRVHFKNGLSTMYAGAIYSNGTLTLESCIFSGNQVVSTSTYSGAVYAGSSSSLTILGCTFYNNTGNGAGAVYNSSYSYDTILRGNLFYGNQGPYPAVRVSKVIPVSNASNNVVDAAFGTAAGTAGWAQGDGDTQSNAMPVSPVSFRLLSGSAAANKLPSGTLRAEYPTSDFYGNSVSANGAAGAVQATVSGSGVFLGLSVNNPAGGTIAADIQPDADGLYTTGSRTITATPVAPYIFGHWLVNGVRDTQSTNSLTITLNASTQVQAVFVMAVTDFTDNVTSGTLRYALTNAVAGDTIVMSGVTPGTTAIVLGGTLPDINKNLTIEGNGVILTRDPNTWTAGASSQLLRTTSSARVTIRGVHFKGGSATNYGGAVYAPGALTLESCIFSANESAGSSGGGAISASDNLTIRGCTFYNNSGKGTNAAGAVYYSASSNSYTLTLEGNLFYGNSSEANYPVLRRSNSYASFTASYNMVDAGFMPSDGASIVGTAGWAQGTGDALLTAPPVAPVSFKLVSGSAAANKLPNPLPAGYPSLDFYGSAVSAAGAAGAVQATSTSTGFFLGLSVNSPAGGTITTASTPDTDGLYATGSHTITAAPVTPYSFGYWLVNGIRNAETGTTLTINNLNAHTQVQAVFVMAVTDFTDGTGLGTLRYALTNAVSGDTVMFNNVTPGTTITLGTPLDAVSKNLTIEGNGVILTCASTWSATTSSQLLRISSTAAVTIRRIHFKGGSATNYGGAVRGQGTLTLESCIFSANESAGSGGGAVTSSGNLTIRGCTFYNNTGTGTNAAGAVYYSSTSNSYTLTLEGNLFYGNTSEANYPVLRKSNANSILAASYNVVDADFMASPGLSTVNTCGWSAETGDKTLTTLGITGAPFDTTTFVPVSGLGSVISSAPTNFPATDFNGATRTFPGAPGAVKQQ
jgi:hypothetical protein